MKVSVLFVKTLEGSKCFIERDESNWLRFLKDSIAEYMKNRFVTEKESVLSFCELAPCFKKLQVIVNTFIYPSFHFSWIISSAELPDFEKVEIQEFLLEPIPDPDAPEPVMEECDTLAPEPEPIEAETTLAPSSYEPEALAEAQRRERKMKELEAEIANRKIKELEAQLEELKNRTVTQIIEPITEVHEVSEVTEVSEVSEVTEVSEN